MGQGHAAVLVVIGVVALMLWLRMFIHLQFDGTKHHIALLSSSRFKVISAIYISFSLLLILYSTIFCQWLHGTH